MTLHDFAKRVILILVLLVLCAAFWYLRRIWILAFMGIIVAIGISLPSLYLQSRFQIKRAPAVVLSFFLILILFYVLAVLLYVPIAAEVTRLASSLPTLIRDAIAGYEFLVTSSPFLEQALPNPFDSVTGEVAFTREVVSEIRTLSQNLLEAGIPLVGAGVNLVVGILGNFFIVLLVAIYLLADPYSLIQGSLYLVTPAYQPRLLEIWNELYKTIANWLRVQFTAIAITGLLVWVILGLILDLPNALTVAMFAGFATFIPNIGIFLPLIPIILFQLAEDPSRLLIVVVAYLLIQTVESNFLTPSIVKSRMKIPASSLTIFQLTAAIVFGPIGIVLAIPLLAVAIVMVRELYSFDMLGLRHRHIVVRGSPTGQLTADFDGQAPPPRGPWRWVWPAWRLGGPDMPSGRQADETALSETDGEHPA